MVFIPWDAGLEHSMKLDEKVEEQRLISEIDKQNVATISDN